MRSLSTFWHLPPRHLGHPSPEQREEMALNDADSGGTAESLMEGDQSKSPCVLTVESDNMPTSDWSPVTYRGSRPRLAEHHIVAGLPEAIVIVVTKRGRISTCKDDLSPALLTART